MIRIYITIIVLACSSLAFAQEEQEVDSLMSDMIIIKGDTIPRSAIDLDEVIVFNKLKFPSYKEKVRYYILRRKTLKVYPYAKMAADRLTELNKRLSSIESRRQKRRYTKKIQKFIEKEFSAELKKLTRTEGQILIKLIHRQTGITAFNLIKELRNGWRAFWYNTTASMFDISLKREFHPESNKEDYHIEDILQRAFADKRLEPQKSALQFNYLELTDKWSDTAEKK